MTITSAGYVGINTITPNPSAALTVNGVISSNNIGYFNHISANTKSFYIDHPSIKGKKLQYGSLESPYHGIRLTGKSLIKDNSIVISLPHYIKDLVKEDEVNVQLTNINHSKILFVKNINISKNYFEIGIDKSWFDKNSYEFFWSFTAIRKDIEDLKVEV